MRADGRCPGSGSEDWIPLDLMKFTVMNVSTVDAITTRLPHRQRQGSKTS